MLGKLTPKNIIAFTKLCLVISLLWPLPAIATNQQVVRFRVLRLLTLVNICALFIPLILTLQDWNDHFEICIKTIPLIIATGQSFIEMGICHGQHKHLQLYRVAHNSRITFYGQIERVKLNRKVLYHFAIFAIIIELLTKISKRMSSIKSIILLFGATTLV
ncbi:Odorant receptor 402, partial [Nylanderia fulva]